MELDDPVHGTEQVEEPVLQELVNSEPVQRLKHINQAGPQKYYMEKPVTRFDHSVGVMLLLKQFDAPLEEQVAGLLHDVPHTAFSHLADYVFETENHEYHERFMEDVVRDSDIPAILKRHGISPDHILDEDNFPLLEQDIPDLCADRIDYFLRSWAVVGGEDVDPLRRHLAVDGDLFIITDRDAAEEYALSYLEADKRWWANPKELAIWELFSRAIRRALDIGVLSEDDLFGTDDEVYRKLAEADDGEIDRLLSRLDDGIEVEVDGDDPDFVAETKFRYVDPVVVDGGERCRVTDY
ncbi:MAG: HD domain-containing protein, partial [Candidatus Nanohaloarchaea archaeon]|nr:HD domain-containing protein [Candidatus Nanohaloarchaea archaeon]